MKKLTLLLLSIQLFIVGRATEYNCDVLRQHGILTPKCKARYIVHEGRQPLVTSDSNDNERTVVEFEERRTPLPIRRKETRIIDSTNCQSHNNDGNWLLNLFNNMYRQLVVCDAFKLKHAMKPLYIVEDRKERHEIRRAPVRKRPLSKSKQDALKTPSLEIDFSLDEERPQQSFIIQDQEVQSFKTADIKLTEPLILSSSSQSSTSTQPLKTPSMDIVELNLNDPKTNSEMHRGTNREINREVHKMLKPHPKQKKNIIHSKIKPANPLNPKKSQLGDRYKHVESLKWRDPLEDFLSVEAQKRIHKKLQVQPKSLNRSKFHSRIL